MPRTKNVHDFEFLYLSYGAGTQTTLTVWREVMISCTLLYDLNILLIASVLRALLLRA